MAISKKTVDQMMEEFQIEATKQGLAGGYQPQTNILSNPPGNTITQTPGTGTASINHTLYNQQDMNQYTWITPDSGIAMNNLSLNIPAAQFVYNITGEPLKQTIFPFTKPSVFKYLKDPGSYQLATRLPGQEIPDTTSSNQPLYLQFNTWNKETAKGVDPGQLLIATIDFLSEDPTDRVAEAIKHLQYALAYLDKEALETNKTNNG